MKKFPISYGHWLAFTQAIDESLENARDNGVKLQKLGSNQKWLEDELEVEVSDDWKNRVKEILSYHPERDVAMHYIGDLDILIPDEETVTPLVSERGQSLVEVGLGLMLVAIVAVIFLAILGPHITKVYQTANIPAPPPVLSDIPLSEHAQEAHVTQAYNALNLSNMYDNGKCRQTAIFWCPQEWQYKYLCEIREGFWGGVAVGFGNSPDGVRITGYASRYSYWQARTEGCVAVPVKVDFLQMAAP